MSSPVVLCVGRVYCDVVFSGMRSMPVPGDEIYARGLSLHTGGGAAITACYLAHLGQSVELCANLPAAPFSQQIHDDLGDRVSLGYSSASAGAEPQITVVLTGVMDRSFITRRVGQALPDNYADLLTSRDPSLPTIKHLHIGELATLLDYPELLTLAAAENWSVSLDCAWDTDALSAADAARMIEGVDIFLPNESEFAQLQKSGVSVHSASLTVIKKGAAGAQAYSETGVFNSVAEQVQCVDSTGAGDAFNAGFIHAWLRNEAIDDCLLAGNRCGAMAVSQVGGIRGISGAGEICR